MIADNKHTPANSLMFKAVLLSLSVIALTACATSPYEDGKSVADVPAHVNVVKLQRVYMIGISNKEDSSASTAPRYAPDPPQDPNPSQNDREVTAIAKTSIVNQLTNLGYSITEDDHARADIALRFFIGYQPERWPLIDRMVFVTGRTYSADGIPFFSMRAARQNSIGLIGAIVGPSRDDMVAEAAREAVVKVVTEMRKGTMDNLSVADSATPASPTSPNYQLSSNLQRPTNDPFHANQP